MPKRDILAQLSKCMNDAGHRLSREQLRDLYTLHYGTLAQMPGSVMRRVVARMDDESRERTCRAHPQFAELCQRAIRFEDE